MLPCEPDTYPAAEAIRRLSGLNAMVFGGASSPVRDRSSCHEGTSQIRSDLGYPAVARRRPSGLNPTRANQRVVGTVNASRPVARSQTAPPPDALAASQRPSGLNATSMA